MDNNQKGAFLILGTIAAAFGYHKYKEKKSAPSFMEESMLMGSFSKHEGHQGYSDREDESLYGLGPQKDYTQSLKDRQDESYGVYGKRMMEHPHQHLDKHHKM